MGVFPSDHVIAKPRRYLQLARAAFRAAQDGRIGVLGIAPRWAETGYGYIEFPRSRGGLARSCACGEFSRKARRTQARSTLRAKRFFWNAGMFFWRAGVFSMRCATICRRPRRCWLPCPAFPIGISRQS